MARVVIEREGVYNAGAMKKRLYRSRHDRIVAGVCGGLADYAGGDPALWRLLAVFTGIISGIAPLLVAYLVAWVIVPNRPE